MIVCMNITCQSNTEDCSYSAFLCGTPHPDMSNFTMERRGRDRVACFLCMYVSGTTAKHVVFLAGNTAKHGLRCKACKMSLHHKCENGVGQQRCMGKLVRTESELELQTLLSPCAVNVKKFRDIYASELHHMMKKQCKTYYGKSTFTLALDSMGDSSSGNKIIIDVIMYQLKNNTLELAV